MGRGGLRARWVGMVGVRGRWVGRGWSESHVGWEGWG